MFCVLFPTVASFDDMQKEIDSKTLLFWHGKLSKYRIFIIPIISFEI